jgi:hypothetical protein
MQLVASKMAPHKIVLLSVSVRNCKLRNGWGSGGAMFKPSLYQTGSEFSEGTHTPYTDIKPH